MKTSLKQTEIIAPNFKKRLSGVTSTIIQLIPYQRRRGIKISATGFGLPDTMPTVSLFSLVGLWRKPADRSFRIWHARRNIEMVFGLIMRDILRMKVRLIFTSAAQRNHKAFTKYLIRKMDRVVATSARSGSYLEVPHQVIMHGVDLERFPPPQHEDDQFSKSGLPGKYAIGCFGRIRHQKGTDLFVDAMIALLPQFPEWTAVITGRVTSEHEDFAKALKQKIKAAGLEERILFLGEVDDITLWYRRLTLYVTPSRNEGFGLTPLEAMASKTAVVASDAGSYKDLVPSIAGTVVPADDGPALEAAIRPYLEDPQMTLKTGERALDYVREHFPLEKEAMALNAVYEDLFAQK